MLSNETVEALIRELPDAGEARLFYDRITREHPNTERLFAKDGALLADALALAAWSPLLATTLAQHPEHLTWLQREKKIARARTVEELNESLARYAATNTRIDLQTLLARFRRRELLRVTLRDVLRHATLVETIDELSNLADAILEFALAASRQELDNLYGAPLVKDARGRTQPATFAVVALGKLGSRELNYSSDIDLMFIFSEDGATAGGVRDAVTNREYFAKLAERISRTVGGQSVDVAAYRVDLRLRPHGRVGALATSLAEAVRYYTETAATWERQALIRARVAAGSSELFQRFASRVREQIYRTDVSVSGALAAIKRARQQIEREHRSPDGFNVKLGNGGVREIEFIAQALQLAHGGADVWLRHAHTLVSLERLAERKLLQEAERSRLADAYDFLRTLEHRLQIEHGLQTHTVPADEAKRLVVARRMNFTGANAVINFDRALAAHTRRVRSIYERVFDERQTTSDNVAPKNLTTGDADSANERADAISKTSGGATTNNSTFAGNQPAHFEITQNVRLTSEAGGVRQPDDTFSSASLTAATVAIFAGQTFAPPTSEAEIRSALQRGVRQSDNPARALKFAERVAASLNTSAPVETIDVGALEMLMRVCGASEFFGEMIASNPRLLQALPRAGDATACQSKVDEDYAALFAEALDESAGNFRARLTCLRRAWSNCLIRTGTCDATGAITMRQASRRQSELARHSIEAGLRIARSEIERERGALVCEPRLAVLGLGRIGGGGMDYGSDLDLIMVFDGDHACPSASLTHEQFYAKFVELFVVALSSLTRDGYLYRVDLRLRPDGKNGALACAATTFFNYLSERAHIWELLAYVELAAVGGTDGFAQAVETEALTRVHDAAGKMDAAQLAAEVRHVRERLEQERGRAHSIDIKYSAGGMLDVYFLARFLQLRKRLPDSHIADRSTVNTLARLRETDALSIDDHTTLHSGYEFLRRLDHQLRLVVGRSTALPAALDHPLLAELASRLDHQTGESLVNELRERRASIRRVFERVVV